MGYPIPALSATEGSSNTYPHTHVPTNVGKSEPFATNNLMAWRVNKHPTGGGHSGSVSVSVSESRVLLWPLGMRDLTYTRPAIEYVGWAYGFCEELKGHRNAKDQLLRASQAIPLNIAEGNGKGTDGDHRRYFEVARGSALEYDAVQDVLQACGRCPRKRTGRRKRCSIASLRC